MTESLVIAYWNTSLSPATGRGQTSQQQDVRRRKLPIAKEVVEKLVTEGVDCLAVAEVDAADLTEFYTVLAPYGYDYLPGVEKSGRTRFDLGLFYNATKIDIVAQGFLTTKIVENVTKNALNVTIKSRINADPVHLLILHWPSRLHEDLDLKKRERLAYDLRRTIDNDFLSQGSKYIVFLGDFNDEPFDAAVLQGLNATRDIGRVLAKSSLLYNPFWRLLGARDVFEPGESTDIVSGTYFHKSGNLTRWKTLDQMIFSAQFLKVGGWLLDEAYCSIWYNGLLNLDTFKEYGFDHFPIVSRIIFDVGEVI